MESYTFKTVTFGGFDKQDVAHYVEQLTQEHSAALSALQEENAALKEKSSHLEAENRRLRTQADIHEQDETYLAACRESAELIIDLCGWEKIDCSRDGQIRSPEDIHREVLTRVEDLLVP